MKIDDRVNIYFTPHIHRLIKKELLEYCSWLFSVYDFPKKLNIYISAGKWVHGDIAVTEKRSLNFFGYFDKTEGSILKLPVGDYVDLLHENSFSEVIEIMLFNLSIKIQNYYQWVDDLEFDEEEAKEGAQEMLDEYYD